MMELSDHDLVCLMTAALMAQEPATDASIKDNIAVAKRIIELVEFPSRSGEGDEKPKEEGNV